MIASYEHIHSSYQLGTLDFCHSLHYQMHCIQVTVISIKK